MRGFIAAHPGGDPALQQVTCKEDRPFSRNLLRPNPAVILGGIFAVRDDIKSKLDAVFAKHDDSKRKATEAQHKESSFLRAFLDAREKTFGQRWSKLESTFAEGVTRFGYQQKRTGFQWPVQIG